MKALPCALFVLSVSLVAIARAAEPAAAPPDTPARYTFTWPLDASAPAPRGGSTQGVTVTPDTSASAAWHTLQAPGLSKFERDRRAILAMAGAYRVTFDFLEIETFKPGARRDRPYQSWGTERVYVDQDHSTFISLVHILDMRVIQKDGTVSGPLVQKHWRQDWQFQPKELIEYQGYDQWRRRSLATRESTGRWSQTVDQVDESIRYASIGHWDHSASFSSWISGDTWRPLPRREESVRKDYQVLTGTNRVTVTATGWIQEENNLKTVVTSDRKVDVTQPYLSREYGVARYELLRDADFAAADQYYRRTQRFWDDVHTAWNDLYLLQPQLTLHASPGAADPQDALFDYADQLASGHTPGTPATEVIAAAITRPHAADGMMRSGHN